VIVPRFGQSAVDRNTVKRRLRELARTELLPALSSIDVVVRALPGAYGASFNELQAAVRQALKALPQGDAEVLS
jgi:ribonuclease P protein component